MIFYYLDASAWVKRYYWEPGTREDRLVFVASDRELKDAAQASGLAVIDPEDQEQQATSPGDRAQEEDEA